MSPKVLQALAGNTGNMGLPALKLGPTDNPYEEQIKKQAQPFSAAGLSPYSPVTPFNTMQPPSYGANAPTPWGQRPLR